MTGSVARRLRGRLALTTVAVALPLLFLMTAIFDIGGLDSRTRDASLDAYTGITPFIGDRDLAARMVFVDIDETSLAQVGQWPWPRHHMATLLRTIGDAGPLAIGLDILMSEDDRFNARAIAALGGLPEGALAASIPDGDAVLGEMLSSTPSVIAVSLTGAASANPPFVPAGVSVIGQSALPMLQGNGLLSPVEKLARAPGAGFVSLALERDSTVRHVPMVARFGDRVIPSMTADMLRLAQGSGGHILKQAADAGTGTNMLRSGRITMPLDRHGRFTLYHGFVDRFTTVPATDILTGTRLHRLTDSFVVIGSSAAGLKDTHSTSLEAAIPGPMVHLAVLHQILSGVTLKSSDLYIFGELLAAAALAVIAGLVAAHAPVATGLAATALATLAAGCGGYWLFASAMYLSNAVLGAGMALLTGSLTLMLRGIADELARRRLRGAFGQYLSPQMVRTIELSRTAPELGGVTTDISVMFMDVRGFTALSESLAASPQTLTRLINIILDEASEVILAHQGTLDKFIGDCVMAFWNAPLPQADHHDRAVAAAIALQNHVPAINARLAREIGDAWPEDGIAIGVGLASGTVVVGNFGSRTRLSYSVVGDTVNLAARLEPCSKQTGLPLTIAGDTAAATGRDDLPKIDTIAVRGRADAIPVHSWLPLPAATRKAHDALVDKLLAAEAYGDRAGLCKAHRALAAMPGYPRILADYYRRRIAALLPRGP